MAFLGRRSRSIVSWTGLTGLLVLAACAADFDTTRKAPTRGSVGEEVYAVFCDRVGAQALPEDLTGVSYRGICHRREDGTYAEKVDLTLIPTPFGAPVDKDGKPLTPERETELHAIAVRRIETLGRRRGDLVAALDAAIPAVKIPIKDNRPQAGLASCNAPADGRAGEAKLTSELAALLSRTTELYNDGTLPNSTKALGALMERFVSDVEGQDALARIDTRQGYRPSRLSLGALRPVVAYPRLRELGNATLRLFQDDQFAFDLNPPKDPLGNRIRIPGDAYVAFSKFSEVLHEELRTVTPNEVVPPLVTSTDGAAGRDVLSRPRTKLDLVEHLAFSEDPAFGTGTPRYIVRRDPRGIAGIALVNGAVPAPFQDADGDLLPDLDRYGRFKTASGGAPPSPFFAPYAVDAPLRDEFGRAVASSGGPSLYTTFDTQRTLVASMLANVKPLLDPSVDQKNETVMDLLAGLEILLGTRDGSAKSTAVYPPDPGLVDRWKRINTVPPPADLGTRPVSVAFDAFHTENSPLLDLVYAAGQIVADEKTEDLLQLVKVLLAEKKGPLARTTGALLEAKRIADRHPEAKIPANSVFWDEMIDWVVKVAKEPGLLEDLARLVEKDETVDMLRIFGTYAANRDRVSYDRNNLNGPVFNVTANAITDMKTPVDRTQPDNGFNRSGLQRFLALVHAGNGVTLCNKPDTVSHAKGLPIVGDMDLPSFLLWGKTTFSECEVLKIDNIATFYLRSVLGKSDIYLRDKIMREGLFGSIGATTTDTLELSSGIKGFWGTGTDLRPKPEFFSRLAFFDQVSDSPNPGGKNYTSNHFLRDFQGAHIGNSACPVRVISDPVNDKYTAKDGKVRLRACTDGEWLEQAVPDTLFIAEQFGFLNSMKPFLSIFIDRDKDDLFLELMEILHRHWASEAATDRECRLSSDPNAKYKDCSRDGIVRYEPLLVDLLASDLIPSAHDLMRHVDTLTVKHCDALDPGTKKCTATHDVNAVNVLVDALRAMVDPDRALAQRLTDRRGNAKALRNDGTTNPQVTPIYLAAAALNGIDKAFADNLAKNPVDTERLEAWRRGRSRLVDQFFSVTGDKTNAEFANPATLAIVPILVDTLRAQILAECPKSVAPPYERCTWARDTLTQKLDDILRKPLVATGVDLFASVRKDERARRELEALAVYLLDAASDGDALSSVLATSSDFVQLLRDDINLVPLMHLLATASEPTVRAADGTVVQKSLIDASLSVVSKVTHRVHAADGTELCFAEMDPNQVLPKILANLVTPRTGTDGKPMLTPLETIIDVVLDVNRKVPGTAEKLDGADFASVGSNVASFLLDRERGLEQFYAIIKKGTSNEDATDE
ncbi:MAG: hypothetical protein U0169_12315 [Polyangiaceae bacterium]